MRQECRAFSAAASLKDEIEIMLVLVEVEPSASLPRPARALPLLVQIKSVFFCELCEEGCNSSFKHFTDYLSETMGW